MQDDFVWVVQNGGTANFMAMDHLGMCACLWPVAIVRKGAIVSFLFLGRSYWKQLPFKMYADGHIRAEGTPASWMLFALEGMSPHGGLSGWVSFSKHRDKPGKCGCTSQGAHWQGFTSQRAPVFPP